MSFFENMWRKIFCSKAKYLTLDKNGKYLIPEDANITFIRVGGGGGGDLTVSRAGGVGTGSSLTEIECKIEPGNNG